MKIKLFDGLNKPVACTRKAVKNALIGTDMVEIEDYEIHISNFYSDDGDEIDVYDGRLIYDPQQVFETNELDEAVAAFFDIIEKLQEQN